MRKYDLAKSGDKIKFQYRRQVANGKNYQQGKIYDGYIVSHYIESQTALEFIGDDGSLVKYTIFHNEFDGSSASFEILISDEDFETRKAAWLAKSIEEAIAQAEHELKKTISKLNAVRFS